MAAMEPCFGRVEGVIDGLEQNTLESLVIEGRSLILDVNAKQWWVVEILVHLIVAPTAVYAAFEGYSPC